MIRYIFIFLCLPYMMFASEVVNRIGENNKNVTFFLSTPRSGSNVVSTCLSAITKKPISWVAWGDSILEPSSKHRDHLSYNRLGLNMVSDLPLLYRTHQWTELRKIPKESNKLIFVTRNPKELIYRNYLLHEAEGKGKDPSKEFIEKFLKGYLGTFKFYESWCSNNRLIVFYEDFIANDEEVLLELLDFMNESPVSFEEFVQNKSSYLEQLLESYSLQHKNNRGGSSSKDGAKAVYYTKDASVDTLTYIDEYIKTSVPGIWFTYLKRFKTNK